MSMNFQIVRYNFISQKVRKPLRIVMIADLHNQVYGLENTDLLTAIDTEQPDIILLPGGRSTASISKVHIICICW